MCPVKEEADKNFEEIVNNQCLCILKKQEKSFEYEINYTFGTFSVIIILLMCFSWRYICLGCELRMGFNLFLTLKCGYFYFKRGIITKTQASTWLLVTFLSHFFGQIVSIAVHAVLIKCPGLASLFSGKVLEIGFPGYLALNNFQL